MNHWNYTQMIQDKPGIDQRERQNLAEYFRMRPDYSDESEELQEAIGDSS